MTTTASPLPPESILSHWEPLTGGLFRPFGNGLINSTFLVEGNGQRFVLQRLHPVFAGSVNEDIDAVTTHLAAQGLVTPRVVATREGRLWQEDADGRPWRVLTFVDGASVEKVDGPLRARHAGRLLGRFHSALTGFEWQYRHVRSGVHDTCKHLETLRLALTEHSSHRLFDSVAPLAERLLARAETLPDLSSLPLRHVHGDPKIANMLFDAYGEGVCLVDLDTVGLMPWPHELGDALRSWCNPGGEDSTANTLSPDLFQASVEGYAAASDGMLTRAELERLVDGVAVICLELAARFLADALNESYFGWNPTLFASRGEHNLIRALGQWSLHESVEAQRGTLERIATQAFADLLRSSA